MTDEEETKMDFILKGEHLENVMRRYYEFSEFKRDESTTYESRLTRASRTSHLFR